MCLAVPGKIVKIEKDIATVDYGIEKRTGKIVDTNYNDKKKDVYKKSDSYKNDEYYKIGDYVLIQGGIVIQKIEKKEALRALKLYKEAVK